MLKNPNNIIIKTKLEFFGSPGLATSMLSHTPKLLLGLKQLKWKGLISCD